MASTQWGQWQIVCTVPLATNTTQRYFVKTHDEKAVASEFRVVKEITSGDWARDPAPHLYEIEPLSPLSGGS